MTRQWPDISWRSKLSLGGQRLNFKKCANLYPVCKEPSGALEGTCLLFGTLHHELSKRQAYKQTPKTHNKQPPTSHMPNIWQICHYLSLCVCCHTTSLFPHSQQPLHSTWEFQPRHCTKSNDQQRLHGEGGPGILLNCGTHHNASINIPNSVSNYVLQVYQISPLLAYTFIQWWHGREDAAYGQEGEERAPV